MVTLASFRIITELGDDGHTIGSSAEMVACGCMTNLLGRNLEDDRTLHNLHEFLIVGQGDDALLKLFRRLLFQRECCNNDQVKLHEDGQYATATPTPTATITTVANLPR